MKYSDEIAYNLLRDFTTVHAGSKTQLNIASRSKQLTGTLSGYFFLIFSPSALLFSNGCSSLYSHLILTVQYKDSLQNNNIWAQYLINFQGFQQKWRSFVIMFGAIYIPTRHKIVPSLSYQFSFVQ